MKERPILFSGPMVKAILEGRKTQTRRVMKPQPELIEDPWPLLKYKGSKMRFEQVTQEHCPHGRRGDRLWVREAWSHDAPSLEECEKALEEKEWRQLVYGPYYRATEIAPETLKWKPSIHMPRWASRIDLMIKDVRVERLCDISEDDAMVEGVKISKDIVFPYAYSFAELWDKINGEGEWNKNPWVWVVEFERIKP